MIHALNSTSTKYLVIGGYAVLYYGYSNRQVDDLDIWVNNSQDNAERLISALQTLLQNNEPPSIERLVKPTPLKIDLRNSRYEVELLTMVKGVSFENAYSDRKVSSQDGENIDIVSIGDLLTIKRIAAQESATRLHKELKDIGFLESRSEEQ
ncbi:MAG TPA: hypothetical protein VFN94_03380 [Nitrospiria bacterium]|nr:hypothetical protein [Nitrospiria bacterium]